MLGVKLKSAIAAIFCLVTYSALAQQQTIPQGIKVSGKAKVSQPASLFSLSFEVSELGFSATKTKALVDNKSNSAIAVLKALDIPDKAINSAELRLFTVEDRNEIERLFIEQGFKNRGQSGRVLTELAAKESSAKNKQILFRVTRVIKVSFADIDIYDQLLDKLVKVGVTRLSPLSSSVTNAEQHYQAALSLAIEKAREKAQRMAKKAQVNLGPIIYLEELSYYAPQAEARMMSSARMHKSYHGEQSIGAEVHVIFAIHE